MEKPIRLQKFLADQGLCSRRQGEALIEAGRVSVNGKSAYLGQTVTGEEKITVDGKPVRTTQRRPTYLILYKPRGYVTTLSDELGRKCVKDLIPNISARVYPVGRLDKDSEGMLLLTDDGELAHRLASPSAHIPKTYRVTVNGELTDEQIRQMSEGMALEDGEQLQPAEIQVREKTETRSVFHITIYEGKNRQIRRMCEQLGLQVKLLKRESIAQLRLGNIKPGQTRFLTDEEVQYIKSL